MSYGKYAKDKNYVYCLKDPWENVSTEYSNFTQKADSKTFEILSPAYAKDKNYVYNSSGAIIKNADPKTFKINNKSDICDYKGNIKISCPQTYNAYDKNSKYSGGKKIITQKITNELEDPIFYETILIQKNKLNLSSLTKPKKVSGKILWNKKEKAIELEANSRFQDTNLYKSIVNTKIKIPEETELLKFKYKFPESQAESLLEIFINKRLVYKISSDFNYHQDEWCDSLLIRISNSYNKNEVNITFKLSKIENGNDTKKVSVFLDSISSIKLEKMKRYSK